MSAQVQLSASIVITNYNYGRYVSEAIQSALEQTHPVQVIVVDDASTDGSQDIVRRFGSRVTPLMLPTNRGQAAAVNAGVQMTYGEIVLFLDSDDYLRSDRVQRVVEGFLTYPAIDVVRHDMNHVDSDGTVIRERVCAFTPESDPRLDLYRYGIFRGNQGVYAYRRSFLDKIGPVPEDCYGYADAYLATAAAVIGTVHTIPEPFSFHRVHVDQSKSLHGADPRFAERLIKWKWCQARDAARLAGAFGGDIRLARGQTWWQAKAMYEYAKTAGHPWIRPWLRHLSRIPTAPLPLTRKLLELVRSASLGLVPKKRFPDFWWRTHTGRPQIDVVERVRSHRLIERQT